jgi:DNA-directed RNA polymerase specialized sigma24 family protein
MVPDYPDADKPVTGNDPLDQAEWDFCAKSGYEYGGEFDDPYEADERVRAFRRLFKKLLAVASPQERVVLKTALAQLRVGDDLNWEAIARDLGKSSGAVKTQVRRAFAKLLRSIGLDDG